jgi:hypothetical protein
MPVELKATSTRITRACVEAEAACVRVPSPHVWPVDVLDTFDDLAESEIRALRDTPAASRPSAHRIIVNAAAFFRLKADEQVAVLVHEIGHGVGFGTGGVGDCFEADQFACTHGQALVLVPMRREDYGDAYAALLLGERTPANAREAFSQWKARRLTPLIDFRTYRDSSVRKGRGIALNLFTRSGIVPLAIALPPAISALPPAISSSRVRPVYYSRRMQQLLQIDLGGRLRNFKLPPSRALVPLFEALVNALHAIDESRRKDGRVTIEVLRLSDTAKGAQQPLPLDERVRQPLIGFRIVDNGIGFTDENFRSFCTSDSVRKASIGGRGIGRLAWLKAFKTVLIRSVYSSEPGKLQRREFTFSEAAGVSTPQEAPVDEAGQPGTTVTLEQMADEYVAQVPKRLSTMAQHIVDHCFLAIWACPQPVAVRLVDGDESTDISAEVRSMFAKAAVDEMVLAGSTFRVTHLRVVSPEASMHRLLFMASRREVRREPLGSRIPQLRGRLEDADGSFWWWSLIESPALDHSVTGERDGFTIPDGGDDETLPEVLSISKVRDAALEKVAARVAPFIEPIKERTRTRVRQYVENTAPEYRHILKMRPEAVDNLPPDLPSDKLDSELHKLQYALEASVRAEGAKLLSAGDEDVDASAYEQFLSDENAIGKANLAKYVVHRRRVLDLLRKALKRAPDGKYSLEQAVHQLVFPLKTTSDDVPYEQMNLWMIDERLAYHYYLASDKQLRSVAPLENESAERPDLIVFNSPFAFSDHEGPFSSIVIVEFKRPARDEYSDEENPIRQVFDYIKRVRDGRAKDRAGRPMNVPEHVPFYCYVVCDLTPNMVEHAESYTLTRTPDGEGFFGFNLNRRAYIEVLSFTKVVDDAEKRNRVLFEKLNIPKS